MGAGQPHGSATSGSWVTIRLPLAGGQVFVGKKSEAADITQGAQHPGAFGRGVAAARGIGRIRVAPILLVA